MFQESCHVRAVVGGPENDESAGSNHLGDEQIRGRQCRGPQRRTPGGAQRRDGSRACSSPAGESPNWVPTLSVGAHSNLPDSSTLRRIHASRLRRGREMTPPDGFAEALRGSRPAPHGEWPMTDRHRALPNSTSNRHAPWRIGGEYHMNRAPRSGRRDGTRHTVCHASL